VDYIHSLHKDKQKMNQLAARVEQLEAQQRKLLLQREVGHNCSNSEKAPTSNIAKVRISDQCCHLMNHKSSFFARESGYCFQRVLAIAILSVRLSVCLSIRHTQVDQSKSNAS